MEHFVEFQDVCKYYQTGSVKIAAAKEKLTKKMEKTYSKEEKRGGDKDLQPDFAGKEYLLERQLKPDWDLKQ